MNEVLLDVCNFILLAIDIQFTVASGIRDIDAQQWKHILYSFNDLFLPQEVSNERPPMHCLI